MAGIRSGRRPRPGCRGVGVAAAPASVLPRKSDIQAAAASVGGHYRTVVPCAPTTCAINNKWDNGVLMVGIIEHWRQYGTAAYRTYAENWASHNNWTLFSNTSGRDQENPNWNNRMTAGYTYLRLLQAGTPGASVADVISNLDAQLALGISPEREGLVNYVFPGSTRASLSWKYVDANFTALPVWVAMGAETGDERYYNRVRDLQDYQVNVMGLQSPTTRLWFQHEIAKTQTSPNGLPVVWGRGNGWIAAGLALALTELPTWRSEYATYRTRFTDLMNAVRTRQRSDGFWNMNLADPAHSAAPETSATALLAFAMARGIDLGLLDRATYEPVAARAWNGIVATAIATDGHLGFCQGVGGGPAPPPGHFAHPSETSTAEVNCGSGTQCGYCVGAVLLAGTGIDDIAGSGGAAPVRVYEAESLGTIVSSGDSQRDVANIYAGRGRANAATLSGVGDFVEFTATNVPGGTYNLRVELRLDASGGTWQLRTNSVNAGAQVDAFDVEPHYAEVDLGTVTYAGAPATRRFRFIVRGRNAASGGYMVGIDRISLYAN